MARSIPLPKSSRVVVALALATLVLRMFDAVDDDSGPSGGDPYLWVGQVAYDKEGRQVLSDDEIAQVRRTGQRIVEAAYWFDSCETAAIDPAATGTGFFDPTVEPDGLDPGGDLVVVHRGDLVLPSGRLLESGGEYLGANGEPVDVAEPGSHRYSYPYYHLVARTPAGDQLLLGQLVLNADNPPVRWEEDSRFGSATDAGTNWIGGPEMALERFVTIDHELTGPERARNVGVWESAFWEVQGRQGSEGTTCVWMTGLRDGATAMLFSNGVGDDYTPAAAGYGPDGQLVAITWVYRAVEWWRSAGIPGEPPPTVQNLP